MRTKFWVIIRDGEILATMGRGFFFTKEEAKIYYDYLEDVEVKQVEIKIIK